MKLTADAVVIRRGMAAAVASVTAAYEGVDVDVSEVIGEADPVAAAWAAAFLAAAVLRCLKPENARDLLQQWGAAIGRSVAEHPDGPNQEPGTAQPMEMED